jgi:hypothetical protein
MSALIGWGSSACMSPETDRIEAVAGSPERVIEPLLVIISA